jgi:translation elongation factor EF-G
MLDVLGQTISLPDYAGTDFAARVFKVIHDKKGNRVTFIKCLGGSLKLREEVTYKKDLREKVNELRDYQGKLHTNVTAVYPGDLVGITGLSHAVSGMGLGSCSDLPEPQLRPALKAAVLLNENPFEAVKDCLHKLEAADPLLGISYEPSLKEINVQIMGKIQLEVLKELIRERFGLSIGFGKCSIVYRETITAPVMGYGHFEPLRHYAEVHLRLEPNPGGGLTFASELSVDQLASQHQNAICHHVLKRDHKGVLTGSSLTDIRFVLTNGAVHLEHTSGGDLREAAYRAVRQGLEKAESLLLEPYYEFFINVDTAHAGRVLSDINRLHGTFEPPETGGQRMRITGNGPVETFLDYQAELLSFTKGMGAVSLRTLGYFPCHNPLRVRESIAYQKERDIENSSSSVFCTKGAGFEVKWDEAEKYMHLL